MQSKSFKTLFKDVRSGKTSSLFILLTERLTTHVGFIFLWKWQKNFWTITESEKLLIKHNTQFKQQGPSATNLNSWHANEIFNLILNGSSRLNIPAMNSLWDKTLAWKLRKWWMLEVTVKALWKSLIFLLLPLQFSVIALDMKTAFQEDLMQAFLTLLAAPMCGRINERPDCK